MNDSELLERYARTGSPEVFRELVGCHTNFVYSCAMQRLHDAHAAQDVTQAVFLALALKAKVLPPDTPLPGWLYKATQFACAKHQRSEQRRKEREMHASEQLSSPASPAASWAEIEPHLANALDALPDKDREAVFTRFYRQGSYRDVAAILHTTEDSARKRVDRALEKLRQFFSRKGVVLSTAGLAGLLTAHAVQAAPTGLAATASATALAGIGGTLAVSTPTLMLAKGALHAMFIAKIKTISLTAAACLVVTGSGVVVAAKQLAAPLPPAAVANHAAAALSDMPSAMGTPDLLFAQQTTPPLHTPSDAQQKKLDVAHTAGRFVKANPDGSVALEVYQGPNGGERSPQNWISTTIPAADGYAEAVKQSSAKFSAGDLVRVFWYRDADRKVRALEVAPALGPMPAALRELEKTGLGNSPRAVTGDPGKVFKAIDTSKVGAYADGNWWYSYEVGNGQPQGTLKHGGNKLSAPTPGDYILTPWGWMVWQEKGDWLPVAEKPSKGKQLPDPAK